jgi:N-acetylglutamate synthase-like GNAT family acetyltransferase
MQMTPKKPRRPVEIRPLAEGDVATADHIMRVAFGTFLGLPEPASFMGDASYVPNRWKANPEGAFAAVLDGRVVGSNFATRWGSIGFFGPLTVLPELWDEGIGRRLLEPVMALFDAWRVTHAGLFTFAHSPKHVGFYQTLGFWPGHLTAIMARPAWSAGDALWAALSANAGERSARIDGCKRVADAQCAGLDLTAEIDATEKLGLGDTLLIEDDGAVAGFAVCHEGPRTEAGSGACYVKFAAVQPGSGAAQRFERLLDACGAFACSRDAKMLFAGVSTARHDAYKLLLARGFQTVLQGVAMHRPNEPPYSRTDRFVLDDWR